MDGTKQEHDQGALWKARCTLGLVNQHEYSRSKCNGDVIVGYLIRDCNRCGVNRVQMICMGAAWFNNTSCDLFMVCQACERGSIYKGRPIEDPSGSSVGRIDTRSHVDQQPITVVPGVEELEPSVPDRVRDLFLEAAKCRRLQFFEAAGAMFRKTIDVATQLIYQTDPRLADREPARALRVRIKSMGELRIIEQDIVDVADVAALDGNDAAHDIDPYTAEEAEALELLASDLLDRLFVRPARVAAVRERQIRAGQRPA